MLPSDSNPSTEELLRAYARQRRAEAGAPLEIDTATRNLLQAEVSRQFRRAGQETDSWFALRPFLGRRLLWGGAGVVLLLIAGGLWLRFDSQREEELARAQEDRLLVFARSPADHSARQRGTEPSALPERVRRFQLEGPDRRSSEIAAAPPQSKSEETASATVRRAEPETGRVDLAFATRNETEMVSNAPQFQFGLPPPPRGVPAPSPRPMPSPAKAPGGQAVLVQATERFGASRQREAPESQAPVALTDNLSAQPSPTAGRMAQGQPATGLAAQSQFGAYGAQHSQQRFYFQQVDQRTRYRRNLNSPPAPKVLTAFEMQQNGQNLRIVDADGSVYDGVIEPTVSQAQNRALLSRYGLARQPAAPPVATGPAGGMQAAPTQSQPVEVPSEIRTVTQTVVQNEAAPVQSFSFRVMGTNRVLHERVEFEGEFEPGTDPTLNQVAAGAVVNTQAVGVNLVQQANEPKLLEQLQTAKPTQAANALANAVGGRIEGRASVGGKSRFRIEAQQVDR
jgi:hypothetical protein